MHYLKLPGFSPRKGTDGDDHGNFSDDKPSESNHAHDIELGKFIFLLCIKLLLAPQAPDTDLTTQALKNIVLPHNDCPYQTQFG